MFSVHLTYKYIGDNDEIMVTVNSYVLNNQFYHFDVHTDNCVPYISYVFALNNVD